MKKIQSALISVYHKEGLDSIILKLQELGVNIYSTDGTEKYIKQCGAEVTPVEEITSYPSILGGRVKTLHPKLFGGILKRRDSEQDNQDASAHNIPDIDLVVVDLYPFEETVSSEASHQDIIEKIDIGGISLIRAAAKNYKDVLIVSHQTQYEKLLNLLEDKQGESSQEERKAFAMEAFAISSHYDTTIYHYFDQDGKAAFRQSYNHPRPLRYGENPHQAASFFGDFDTLFDKLHGKEISYNNLLDIDAAVSLMHDFQDTTVAILKHNNACGLATLKNLTQAWKDALAGDPVSAFGGIIITNTILDAETAKEMHKIFFEVIIAPGFTDEALATLKQKKNRIILVHKAKSPVPHQFRNILNGVLFQDRDLKTETDADLKTATNKKPDNLEISDLIFANKIVKHSKSNAIVLAKNQQLIASGVGQTSRVDALKQAIDKATHFDFDLNGAVMASDAFFPFKDSVEIACKAGITSVIQPGGSIRDQESIDYCNENNISMIFTGIRHFKH
ncbi:MAG: bifunctional phosphoribosylaminoimidazolecarboxamide formyltransferase/IMP cyclohydrolase [Candidatus Delongbacteria bacterium]|jgi:phosphoribosylaminoimidazolecarboxamide formyltransferase/IMP cyclohydrolase|nr:bifunctional phosphoribosylaminoimidazolecarboxamide formyltransferase/IMP cyclohydrolase [Candidatus Delongbacteria bacterium]